MNVVVVGINHKNTPIEIREKLYLTPVQQDLLLSELKNNPKFIEACVLSTCNRVEIYAHVLEGGFDLRHLLKLVLQIKKISFAPELIRYFYTYTGKAAVRHLLEVSAGLDSLVLGEDQILGQVKAAFERARELGMLQRYFNILSNVAVRTGKKVRHETTISAGGSSISWAAVVKAEEVLGTLNERSILVIGAGEMSELAVGHIQNREFKKLYLMNRTQGNAQSLAEKYGGEAVPFCDLKELLSQVDICICSAGAPHYLLEKNVVERIMTLREHKPLVLIDISMPRNIDPCAAEVTNVLLYQIDDLREVVDANKKMRETAVNEVQTIIDSQLNEYIEKLKRLPHNEGFTLSDSLETVD